MYKAKPERFGFTLMELLAIILLLAVLGVTLIFFVSSYIQFSQQLADRRTLESLNEALTRYKCQGGDVASLTYGAPIANILARLQSDIVWGGINHNVLKRGTTYPARSLNAGGNASSYTFYRFNRYDGYADGTVTPPDTVPYGGGVGYMANIDDTIQYPMNWGSSTGAIAYKNASGVVATCTNGSISLPGSSSYTFWSCVSTLDTTPLGNMTLVWCGQQGGKAVNTLDARGLLGVTSIDARSAAMNVIQVAGLSTLQTLDLRGNNLTSLNLSGLTGLTAIYAGQCNLTGALDLTNCPSLVTVYLGGGGNSGLTAINAAGLTSLANLDLAYVSAVTLLNLNGCSSLASIASPGYLGTSVGQPPVIDLRSTALASSSSALDTFFAALGTVSAPHQPGVIYLGSSGASATDSIATGKGWSVDRS